MTVTPKKQLSKKKRFLLPLFILFNLSSLLFLVNKYFAFVILFYAAVCIFLVFAMFKNRRKIDLATIKKQDLKEKNNELSAAIEKEMLLTKSIEKKNIRYASLKHSLDKFNQSLELNEVGESIVEETFKLFSGEARVVLYMIDQKTNMLEVLASRKKEDKLVIKEKNGDMFDAWVIAHDQALIVEDAEKDFRFDYERIKEEISRPVGSVISAPLATESRFLGILRLESAQQGKFVSEDLRFLATVANLATMALENSLLYHHTEELAIRDGLTGLYLRRHLEERGKEEINYAQRKKSEISVLMIDIDHFKSCNDNYGHHFGDIVLMHIADLLKGMFKERESIVCRYGGEEFAVLLLEAPKAEAARIAEGVRTSIRDGVIFLRRQPIKITVSIGVASFPKDAGNWLDLIKQADEALYKAKQSGRNRVCSI